MRRALVVLSACGGVVAAPPHVAATAVPDDPAASTHAHRVLQAVHHDHRLFMRDARGALVALDDGTREERAQLPGQIVLDLHATTAGELWALAIDGARDVRVWKRTLGGWEPLAQMAGADLPPIGLADAGGDPIVVTTTAIHRAHGGTFSSVKLDHPITKLRDRFVDMLHSEPLLALRLHAHVAVVADRAYAGTNRGEFGGSLSRIELSSGHVEPLSLVDGTLCGGVYNPDCDPITAIVADPMQRGCVLAGVGLVHFGESGRLLRVCDRKITVAWTGDVDPPGATAWVLAPLLRDPREAPARASSASNGGSICEIDPSACPRANDSYDAVWREDSMMMHATQAVFDLARTKDGVWMVTRSAAYFSNGGPFEPRARPETWETIDDFAIASRSGASFVLTDANAAMSLSGYTPLVAPRESEPVTAQPPSILGRCFVVSEEDRVCFERDRVVTKHGSATWTTPATWTLRGATTTLAAGDAHVDLRAFGEQLVASRTDDGRTGRVTLVAAR
jgi:hypothetical protein